MYVISSYIEDIINSTPDPCTNWYEMRHIDRSELSKGHRLLLVAIILDYKLISLELKLIYNIM